MRAWQRSAHAVVLALVLGGTVWNEARVYGADNVQVSTTAVQRASGVQQTRPRLVLWAWSRSDDLSFLAKLPAPDGRVPDVAFLSGEILIGPSGMQVRPRLRRL